MNKKHRCVASLIATTMTALVATALPAVAQQRTVFDVRGDAPPSADIVRVLIRNTNSWVAVSVKVMNLAGGTDMTLTVDHSGPGHYILRTGGLGKGSLNYSLGGNEHKVTCPNWTLNRYTGPLSTMVVRIPQRCFGTRAGTAAFDLTMFQSGGMGIDQIPALPITLRRG